MVFFVLFNFLNFRPPVFSQLLFCFRLEILRGFFGGLPWFFSNHLVTIDAARNPKKPCRGGGLSDRAELFLESADIFFKSRYESLRMLGTGDDSAVNLGSRRPRLNKEEIDNEFRLAVGDRGRV